jgi:hypothetical protein
MSVFEMETQRVAFMWELIFEYYITFLEGEGYSSSSEGHAAPAAGTIETAELSAE